MTRLAERSILAREQLRHLRQAGLWPPLVPAVVFAESLRGDPRRDFAEERLLTMCDVLPVAEATCRRAARLRAAARRGSAIDAIVIAVAEQAGSIVLTQDVDDLAALAAPTEPRVPVRPV